jgi:acyl-CoA synthetase (AMP-forming)/AMP-acid ligase II
MQVLPAGACFIISPHFSPSSFFASVHASKATHIQYIGEMCRYLVSTPPSPYDRRHSAKVAFGNGLRPDVWKQFKERFNIEILVEIYAATESPHSSFVKSRNLFGHGAVGRSGTMLGMMKNLTSMTVKHDVETGEPFRDPKTGFCVKVATNEPGEVISKLDPNDIEDKFNGYWGNDKATESKILRDVVTKGDAYFRTGDLLRTDGEGRTFFVDRIGDTFRWKGENVSTSEVEEVLTAHSAVEEANVCGVQLPGHDGRAGFAAVVLKTEPTADVLADIGRHVTAKLPRYALPIFIRRVETMEVTGTSKYTKKGIREQGADPEKVGSDPLFWLEPKATVYKQFGRKEWERIVSGQIKL